jgi:hypothetical protein
MLKTIPGLLLSATLAFLSPLAAAGDDVDVQYMSLYKDYNGSMEKRSAWEQRLVVEKTVDRWRVGVGYQYATADRFGPRDLRVDKLHADATLKVNETLDWSVSYMAIRDNLAPTDGGRIYGTSLMYRGLPGALALRAGGHYSDYDEFSVSQLRAALIRPFRLDATVVTVAAGAGWQRLDDHEDSRYIANADSHYLWPFLRLGVRRGPYHGSIGIAGRRVFEVSGDGRRVSHHGMEIRRSLAASVGRRFGDLDISLVATHHEAEELPPANRLQLNTLGLSLGYRF